MGKCSYLGLKSGVKRQVERSNRMSRMGWMYFQRKNMKKMRVEIDPNGGKWHKVGRSGGRWRCISGISLSVYF